MQYQLLGIVQEVISNTLAHAAASNLRIRLSGGAEGLQLSLEDDGVGFASGDRRAAFGHFGLAGIAERAEAIGAELSIGSSPGSGTTVRIHLPLSQAIGRNGNAEAVSEHQTK